MFETRRHSLRHSLSSPAPTGSRSTARSSRSSASRAALGAIALLVLATAAPALANPHQWTKRSAGGGATFFAVSAPDTDNVFVGGYTAALQGFQLRIQPFVYTSGNGGQSFRPITPSNAEPATGFNVITVDTVYFLDAATGWFAFGPKVFRTEDGGATWKESSAPGQVRSLHFLDGQNGFASGDDGRIYRSGDGGVTWTSVTSPTSTTLRQQFWVGERLGWFIGHNEEAGNDEEAERPVDPVVLRTTNGGEDWTVTTSLPRVAGLDTVFFLRDGKTGFVSGHTWKASDEREAVLLKTEDGGETFVEMELPLEVGVMNVGFGGDMPIKTSHIRAMYWEDAQRGRLAGMAFLTKTSSGSSSGGGGGDELHWKIVDYLTEDGGTTWAKTDHGKLTGTIFSPPTGDGWVAVGLLRDLHTGWMPGDKGSVWVRHTSCAEATPCGEGYVCNDQNRCERQSTPDDFCLPSCSGGQECVDGTCVALGNGDGNGGTGDGGSGGHNPGGSTGPNDPEDAVGCDCTSAPISGVWLAAAGLSWLMTRRRHHRR